MAEFTLQHIIAQEINVSIHQVSAAISLFEEGASIPFVSRYRKERTGSLDEVQLAHINKRWQELEALEKRKKHILETIEGQGKLSDELAKKIRECYEAVVLEDIYLPYKPKRKTRAAIAKERGLEAFALWILQQNPGDIEAKAASFMKHEDVKTEQDAINGASDIIAEWISENERTRERLRSLFRRKAILSSTVVKTKKEEAEKYSDYFEWEEHALKAPSHRVLAIFRGETEGFLRVKIRPDEDESIDILERQLIKGRNQAADCVYNALLDSYKRLLMPSLENELRAEIKTKADEKAIAVFAENLRQLLLQPPLKNKRVLAIDPGFRTGCKIVCLDATGQLKHNETIYPHPPRNEKNQAIHKIKSLVSAYDIEAIAVGNGTAGRETEDLLRTVRFDREVIAVMVSENGASVYSASDLARAEFPQYDVTVRGAISIGRRLQDPLAELVKIDPKSIGVGQYQHDVDQHLLQEELQGVVESCVNHVGVELNSASAQLLTYVSGLGPALAANIIEYRTEHGAFTSRKQLLKVKRFGQKAFEQAAGFLRIPGAKNPLDNSAVHPESYGVVEKMAASLGFGLQQMLGMEGLEKELDLQSFVDGETGLPTLKDILVELKKPGRDPRKSFQRFEFDQRVHHVEDLNEGMILPGIVTNITAFGAFVDVGVHQDGLVHISQLKDAYVSDPAEVVSLHQHVQVKVLSVDIARKRIALTMKGLQNE